MEDIARTIGAVGCFAMVAWLSVEKVDAECFIPILILCGLDLLFFE
jgi:hypothetical protein